MLNYFYSRDNSVNFSQIILVVLVAILPLFGAGCGEDDNPIVDGDDHDHDNGDAPMHADVVGFILKVDETEVYRQFKGTETGDGLTVKAGEEIEVHVVFLEEDGHEAHLDEVESTDEHGHEEEFGLGITGYDETIIAIHLDHDEHGHDEETHGENDEDAHDEDGEEEHADELPFGLEGLKAGTTEINLQLLHGDHPDFTAAKPIPVTVE